MSKEDKLSKILKELEDIKKDNNDVLLNSQKIRETIKELIEDTNKLTFKLQDIEQQIKRIEE